jgi:hypothetical protein
VRSQPITFHRSAGITQVVESIEIFLWNQRQELVSQLDPRFEFPVARTQDNISGKLIAPDYYFIAFKAKLGRQTHSLTATILEKLGGLHDEAPFALDIYRDLYHFQTKHSRCF